MNINVQNFQIFAISNPPFQIYTKFHASIIMYENFITFYSMLKMSRLILKSLKKKKKNNNNNNFYKLKRLAF